MIIAAILEGPVRTAPATAALLTPPGRGAIATIRAQGPLEQLARALAERFHPVNGRSLMDQPINRICFGRWGAEPGEDVVLCRRENEVLEVHCHGGMQPVQRILDDLAAAGFAAISWSDQSHTSKGALAAECLEALSHAPTLRTANILLDQSSGTLPTAFRTLRDIDVARSSAGWSDLKLALDRLLAWGQFGLHLTASWRVVLTGRPNVGKSSLINALLGYNRSIVYDQPGTTRDVVTAETAIDGWPVQLADTAGLRESEAAIESAGIARARERLAAGDLVLLVLDLSSAPENEDLGLLSAWPQTLVVANKCDLEDRWHSALPPQAIRVSSKTGFGVEALSAEISTRLVPQVPEIGTAVPVTPRQVDWLTRARHAVERSDTANWMLLRDELLRAGVQPSGCSFGTS